MIKQLAFSVWIDSNFFNQKSALKWSQVEFSGIFSGNPIKCIFNDICNHFMTKFIIIDLLNVHFYLQQFNPFAPANVYTTIESVKSFKPDPFKNSSNESSTATPWQKPSRISGLMILVTWWRENGSSPGESIMT